MKKKKSNSALVLFIAMVAGQTYVWLFMPANFVGKIAVSIMILIIAFGLLKYKKEIARLETKKLI